MGLPRVLGHQRKLQTVSMAEARGFSVIPTDYKVDLSAEPPIVRVLIGQEPTDGEVVNAHNSIASVDEWRRVVKRAESLQSSLERGEPLKVPRQTTNLPSDDDELFSKLVRNASGHSFRIGRRRVPKF